MRSEPYKGKRDSPDWVSTPHGRFVYFNDGWQNEFHLRDHLGNTRVVLMEEDTGTLVPLQQNHYYPFGMLNPSLSTSNSLGALKDNRYLYNGKELQDDFGLDWYDYGARFYDAQIGRWHSVDPLAEAYISWTPYQYVRNNPIRRIDPNGMWDDEYYSSLNGKLLGNDGSSTNDMRLIADKDYKRISNTYGGSTGSEATVELQNSSNVISFDGSKIQSDVQSVADNSRSTKLEHSVFIVLDQSTATVTSVEGPTGSNDQCPIDYYPGEATGASFFGRPGGPIIIGQVHGHPASNNFNSTTQSTMSDNDVGVSTSLQIPIYAVDAMSGRSGKPVRIHRANPNGTIDNNIGKTIGGGKHQISTSIDLGRDALRIWGQSKKPTY